MDTADEARLLTEARAGDEEAFGEVVKEYYPAIFRRVVSILRNDEDARDVCQEVWVLAWKRLERFRGDSRFATWVYTIATRAALDHLRKRRRWFDRFLPFTPAGEETPVTWEPEACEPGPRDQLEDAERKARFERALAALPPKHRTVLALREVEGLSYDEIANAVGCRAGTVMSRLYHARRLLLKKLGGISCD